MFKIFNENSEKEIVSIKNKKSNLIMNLPLLEEEKKHEYYIKIIHLELKIVDLELEQNNCAKAARNMMNAIKFIKKVNDNTLLKKVELRGLIEEKFPEKYRNEFGKMVRESFEDNEDNEIQVRKNLYSFIIDKFQRDKFRMHKQNSNKAHLFLFQNTTFNAIAAIPSPDIKISSYPLFSESFEEFVDYCQNQWNFFSIKDKIITTEIYYKKIEKNRKGFIRRLEKFDKQLVNQFEKNLEKFAQWDTKEIIEWEKKTKILEFFTYNSKV